MCLGMPGKVIEITEEDGLLMGKVDYSGTISKTCLSYCGDVKEGEYVIVHAGFAISVLDEESAKETLNYYKQMADEAAKQGKDILDNPLSEEGDSK